MKYFFIAIACFATIILPIYCNGQILGNTDETDDQGPFKLPYDIKTPGVIIYPGRVKDVAGLAIYGEQEIGCVPESPANIYIINYRKDKIINYYRTVNRGITTGLAIAENTAWTIKSDGVIYGRRYLDSKKPKMLKLFSNTSKKSSVTGLTYDKKHERLLMSVKNPVVDGQLQRNYCGVYIFNPYMRTDTAQPMFLVDINQIKQTSSITKTSYAYGGFAKSTIKKEKKTNNAPFSPSGIALHPITEDIYLLSGASNQLVVLTYEGKIKGIFNLDDELFKKSRGITFDESGNMFISSTIDGKPRIYLFYYKEE